MATDQKRAAPSGIARDIQMAIDKNRDYEAEAKAVAWMTEVLGHAPEGYNKSNPHSFEESLKDGSYLCELINKIAGAGSVKKIIKGKGKSGFVLMQNIEAFQQALKKYGCPPEDLFQTVDLWEKRNIPAVTKTIYALSRTAGFKKWDGPLIKWEVHSANID